MSEQASDEDAPLAQALAWRRDGRQVALATVVGTWGSSPRPPGSLLAVADDGAFVGSVSGGCIEGAVVEAAARVIADGRPTLLDFGVSDERAWEVGLACGGRIEVFVEPAMDVGVLEQLLNRRPLALVTDLDAGEHALVRLADDGDNPLGLDADTATAVRRALADDRSIRVDAAGRALFVTAFHEPLEMIIVGAVHVAQALAPMAAQLGFRVTVVDPRRTFGSTARFPGVALVHDWPDEALAALPPGPRTAVVTLSHDPKLDDPALAAALRSPAFYIGALGSRKTHGLRCERLRVAGFTGADLARIHGPVGLDLGGRKAAEIALAILAQAVAARHGRLGGGKD